MASRRLPLNSRKLLVAAIGVAAASYVGCNGLTDQPTSGKLMAGDFDAADAPQPFPTSGNLMAPDAPFDASDGAADDASDDASDAGDGDAAADADADQ